MDSLKCKALIRSVELGSLSAAGEELGYSTAGISQMVTAIENEVGFPVISRGRGGVSLTKNGEILMPALLSYARSDTTIQQISSELNGLVTGKILIGAYSSIAAHWLPKVLLRYKMDYPGINIELMEGIHSELDHWIKTTQMDFCLYSYRDSIDMEWIPLRDDPMYVAVYPHHPFAQRRAIHPHELDGQPFIMPSRRKDMDVIELVERFNVKPDIKYTTIENYSALSMIEYGLGISVMNGLITQGRLNKVILVPFDPPQHIEMGIAVPSLKNASPAAKKLIQYITEDLTSAAVVI